MNKSSTNSSVFALRPLKCRACVLGVVMTPVLLNALGCSYSARERYFDSRAAVVASRQGNGATRIATWPADDGQRQALASLDGKSPTDVVAPKPPIDQKP